MKKLLFVLFLVAVIANLGLAQVEIPKSPGWFNHYGRWSLGVQGGGNMWINDFDTQNFTGGGNAFLRYAFTRSFSLGIMGGWDQLDSKESAVSNGPVNLANGYMQDKGFSGNLVAWFHLNRGKPVAPYIYLGFGMMSYKRTIAGDVEWPEARTYQSLHVPVGLGLE
ncbi:MAG TPA: hypothetical protein VLT13_14010, partial [Bacteroidota bacterium]|nr:hypothetical protein [Bacteroidota bacterium]